MWSLTRQGTVPPSPCMMHARTSFINGTHPITLSCWRRRRLMGSIFAALCLRENAGSVTFTLRGYSVSQEEPEFSVELPVQAVLFAQA